MTTDQLDTCRGRTARGALSSVLALLAVLLLAWGAACGGGSQTVAGGGEIEGGGSWPGEGQLTVHFLDVGQGDSALIVTPTGRTMLVDAGPPVSSGRLVAGLLARGVHRLNLAVMTHADSDHIGGYQDILDNFEVMRFADPGYPHTTRMYAALLERLERDGIPVYQLRTGDTIRLDEDVEARVLFPPEGLLLGTRSDTNTNSTILLVEYGDVQILMMGDAEDETESYLLAHGLLEDVEVLKVAHHGSAHSTSSPFLEATLPDWAIISCGAGNRFGHPAPEALERLESVPGLVILRTDLVGDVTVTTDGRELHVTTEGGALVSVLDREQRRAVVP
jgi:beta-lactamase superfamily II metal-dependent hydrolase